MKNFSLFLIVFFTIVSVSRIDAQVTIGSDALPNANAVLDLISRIH